MDWQEASEKLAAGFTITHDILEGRNIVRRLIEPRDRHLYGLSPDREALFYTVIAFTHEVWNPSPTDITGLTGWRLA